MTTYKGHLLMSKTLFSDFLTLHLHILTNRTHTLFKVSQSSINLKREKIIGPNTTGHIICPKSLMVSHVCLYHFITGEI